MSEAAENLTRFLTQNERYGGKSPLTERVETEIKAMAATIAKEIVAENEDLADVIRRKTRDVIRQALRDDAYLNGTITNAIARVLTERALSSPDAEGSDYSHPETP